MTVIEVFADVGFPFTHVGLRRFVDRRAEAGRNDGHLRVTADPESFDAVVASCFV